MKEFPIFRFSTVRGSGSGSCRSRACGFALMTTVTMATMVMVEDSMEVTDRVKVDTAFIAVDTEADTPTDDLASKIF